MPLVLQAGICLYNKAGKMAYQPLANLQRQKQAPPWQAHRGSTIWVTSQCHYQLTPHFSSHAHFYT